MRKLCVLAGLVWAGCGGGEGPIDAAVSPDAVVADDAFVPADAGPSGPARAVFDLGAVGEDFFAFPLPSDLRLTREGRPDLAGFPSASIAIVADLLASASERPGWPTVPVAYFRFTAPLAERSSDDVLPAELASPFLLIDVDPASPERGALVPTIARTLAPDRYTGSSLVAVAAVPGWVLHPDRRYAFVVRTSATGWDGGPVETEPVLQQLLAGETPGASWGADAAALYAPLRETLATLGLPASEVAAATVFTTADVVADLRTLVRGVAARDDVTIEGLALDPTDGASHPRYCELVGTISMPQFQEGTPLFDTEGRFANGPDGLPVEQRRESVRVVVTVPKTEMPAEGYPVMLYIHGSGGVAAQVVDRGPYGTDLVQAVGEGPAHVMAAHGVGAVGAAMPLSPDRVPGASDIAYINLGNLSAFPYTFRQGVIEQVLLLDALEGLRITPAMLAGCDGASLPAGAAEYRFDPTSIVGVGQSMGAMYLNLLSAIDARITALAPTGAGGFWSYMILETELLPNTRVLLGSVLRTDGDELSHLHPALHLMQLGWEPADPMVYMPRISRRPLEGIPSRPIFEPVGQGDSYFPTVLYDAIALAYGHPQAGAVVWPTMQPRLAYAGLDGLASYPISGNLESERGERYTGAVVQSAGDGFSDPHNIFMQVPEIRHQWSCLLATALDGAPTIVAPAAPGSPCAP
jgi:hypothetical protein